METHLLDEAKLAEALRDGKIMQCNIMSGEAKSYGSFFKHHHQPTQQRTTSHSASAAMRLRRPLVAGLAETAKDVNPAQGVHDTVYAAVAPPRAAVALLRRRRRHVSAGSGRRRHCVLLSA